MNRFGPHAQSNHIDNWPAAVAEMHPGSWFKFMDDVAMAEVVKIVNPEVKVLARFHRDPMQQFSLNFNETMQRARDFIGTWLNESFMLASPYIDAVEDFNEYWASTHTPEETAARIQWVQCLLRVWATEILTEPEYAALYRIKWCLANAAVGNDIPWQVVEAAVNADSGPHYIGYHGYVSVVSTDYQPTEEEQGIIIPGERSPNEFFWGSGRVLIADDDIYKPRGLYPRYIFTEGGLVRDANGKANLMPNDGWRDPRVTNGNMDRYVELMSEVSDHFRAWNQINDDRLEGYVYFTSGEGHWPGFNLNGNELYEIIVRTGDFEGTPPLIEPPPPVAYEVNGTDISHWQGQLDGEISFENGNKFIIIKASDGYVINAAAGQANQKIDPRFAEFTEEAVVSGHLVGAYHFFQPDIDATEQALTFLAALDLVEAQNLPPVLDLEVQEPYALSLYQDAVLEWLNIVEDQTGMVPMIYTNVSFYNRNLNDARFDRYKIWIAFWDSHASKPSLPFRRDTWEFWQWTSLGNGAANGVQSATIDLNRFNGTSYELSDKYLENWLRPVMPPPPPPPPPPDPCPIREQYPRVVHVFPSYLPMHLIEEGLRTAIESRQTVTWSYDDAGATPCEDNTAVLWYIPEEDKTKYSDWFSRWYPNTLLAFPEITPAPAPATNSFIPWWQKIKKFLLRLRR